MKNEVTKPDAMKEWVRKYESARDQSGTNRNKMRDYMSYYKGTKKIKADPNSTTQNTKNASNVRNIVYELIESQVDASIPMPKVRAIHAEDEELAVKITHLLENKIRTTGLLKINDIMERNVPVIGGDYFHVQWDVNKGLHSEIGDLRITEVHPKKLIPQPGVTEFDNMDYFFVDELLTKKTVKRLYGVSVEDAENDAMDGTADAKEGSENKDLVTVHTAYYRNKSAGIGIYVWCDDIEILDMDDYQSRYLERCAKCGTVMQGGKCPSCGGKKAKKMPVEYEEKIPSIEIKTDFGTMQNPAELFNETQGPMLDEMGQPVMDQMGQPVMEVKREQKKIPYYKPNVFPIVLRNNITDNDKLLGVSDVEVIIDQQETIKKLGSNINEKLLKGGSFVTLPKGKKVETTDEQLKIIRLDNPAEKGMIDVINVQPNTSVDENYLETNYRWAKNALGITDAYQGRFNAAEVSGTARQFAINQAAGRLESKRKLKDEAFSKLYEIMFKYWLAYADQTTEISSTNAEGKVSYEMLDRHDFLRIDKSGEFYWDDEFIFETDPTSTLMANREAMWNQTDMKLQSQAFGPLGDMETLRTYWTFMKASGYPNAGMALEIIEERIAKQEQMAQQQAMMQQMGGAPNAMPLM